jgi:hypothetical protein
MIRCQARGNLSQLLDFSPRVKNFVSMYLLYKVDNQIEVNLTMNFGSRNKETELTFGVIAKFDF